MLDSLHIKNFRCFEDLTIPSLGRVNLIVGKNNSGKSTLLDAIYLYANSGNIWAIQKVLTERNEFPLLDTPQQSSPFSASQPNNQTRMAFDALANIFSKNNNSNICLIASKNKSGETISINLEKTTDIENSKKKYNIKSVPSYYNPAQTSQEQPLQEGFLVTKTQTNKIYTELTNYVASVPYTITHDLSQTNFNIPIINNKVIGTYLYYETSLADIWSKLQDDGKDLKINELLKIVEPNIDRAYYTVDGKIAKIQIRNNGTQTLKSLGEGVSRIFQLFILAYASEGGILIIDEIENGLHHSIQAAVWKQLFEATKKLDIQVFATTHSEDTVKAFCKVAVADEEIDGKLIALARSAKTSNEGQIFPIIYEEDKLQTFIEMGMEVR